VVVVLTPLFRLGRRAALQQRSSAAAQPRSSAGTEQEVQYNSRFLKHEVGGGGGSWSEVLLLLLLPGSSSSASVSVASRDEYGTLVLAL
jgi:hypothetical protein